MAQAPTVTSISPNTGSTAGGTVVTVIGSGYAGITRSVQFGSTPAVPVNILGNGKLTAVAPAGIVGTVDITVTTTKGTSTTSSADLFTYVDVPVPVVNSIAANSGPAAGGTNVTITGTGFTNVSAVYFRYTPATNVTFVSDSEITATSPAGTGTVDVTVVTNPGGTSATSANDQFTYIGPALTGISPNFGPAAGATTVTLTGTNFTGATQVLFGSTAVTGVTVVSDSSVTVTSPAGAGVADIEVVTPDGTSSPTSAGAFAYVPTVTGLSVSSGPAAGGTPVTITGSGFSQDASAVAFGTAVGTGVTVADSQHLTVNAPAGSGVVDVRVSTLGHASATSPADQFTYGSVALPPTVTSISPASGSIAGGTTVTIDGTNFANVTAVSFGAAAAASFTIINTTQITAVTAASAAGTVDVTVTNAAGTSAVVAADRYVYSGTPTVTAVGPKSGSVLGGTPVTITGTKFTGATGVNFGTVAAAFTVVSDTSVTATAPVGTAGTVDVTIVTPGGTSAAGTVDQFTYTGVSAGGTTYAYAGTIGTTGVSGVDNKHFNLPWPGAVDTVDNHLLVADAANDRVQILDSVTLAAVATIGTAGAPGTGNTQLSSPLGVGYDPTTGHILVADTGNARIQIFDAKTFAYVSTIGTTGVTGTDNSHFNGPAAVHLNAAKRQLYIADSANDRIQIYNADTLAYVATIGTTSVAGRTDTTFNHPTDAELNPIANEIMVADSDNSRVQLFDADTFGFLATIGSQGLGQNDNTTLDQPVTASFDPINNLVLVADAGPDVRVQVYDAMSYDYTLTLGTAGSAGTSNNQFQQPSGIVVDAAHNKLFIGDAVNDRIQVYTIGTTPILASVLPGSRSVQLGHPATIFATVINAGTASLAGCQVALPVTAPSGLTLGYQTTNPSTNALTGTANTPATIPGQNGLQTFLLTFQGTNAFTANDMTIDFDCLGVGPASVTTGVDTLDLTLSSTPVADIIALAATASNNGTAIIPAGGTGAFAVATDNVGAAASIIVSVDTGSATLPLTPTICQSNASTGACLATPGSSVAVNFTAGATPTFSVFLPATGTIPLDPAGSRVFVRFKDSTGALHGSTSVAVETQ